MRLSIQIIKFKFHEYQMRAVLPNLMLAKVICYTVHTSSPQLFNVAYEKRE